MDCTHFVCGLQFVHKMGLAVANYKHICIIHVYAVTQCKCSSYMLAYHPISMHVSFPSACSFLHHLLISWWIVCICSSDRNLSCCYACVWHVGCKHVHVFLSCMIAETLPEWCGKHWPSGKADGLCLTDTDCPPSVIFDRNCGEHLVQLNCTIFMATVRGVFNASNDINV